MAAAVQSEPELLSSTLRNTSIQLRPAGSKGRTLALFPIDLLHSIGSGYNNNNNKPCSLSFVLSALLLTQMKQRLSTAQLLLLGVALLAALFPTVKSALSSWSPPSAAASHADSASADFPWFDPSLPTAQRVAALISAMSLEQKIQQMTGGGAPIPSLGLPEYNWCSEGSHGVARAGRATVFPSPISLAASFDTELVLSAGQTLATEARAKHNDYTARHSNNSVIWYGLNFLAPVMNLFTHVRWGRGQETWGEDPFVSARMTVAYVKGMQSLAWEEGRSPYAATTATCKHFFSYGSSDQSVLNNLTVSETDLLQTYWPAFRACIVEAKARSIMCSYATINGYQACEHPALQRVLRDDWNFTGFVTADDGAISLIVAPNVTVKAANALNAGVDIGGEFSHLGEALQLGLVREEQIDLALNRSLTVRMLVGKFDPPAMVPWSKLNLSVVDSPPHRAIARRAAKEGSVLLKNDGDLLPLQLSAGLPFSRSKLAAGSSLSRLAVVGPNADRELTVLGN